MSLFVTSLNSGSNGNCYYIGNDTDAVLVDVGISCREVEKRMRRLGLSMQKVKAIFISHEHNDHIRGVCALIKKYQLPVYVTSTTFLHCNFVIDEGLVKHFDSQSTMMIGTLSITAFPKLHDASDPCSFIIEFNDTRVGVFTDIGAPCRYLLEHFKKCHAVFLEANYDEGMLDSGVYPYHLKRRIRGGKGHLSNNQALEIFIKYRAPFLSHLFLSHLSNNNNCPDRVRQLFSSHAGGVKIIVATRFEETPVYHIDPVSNRSDRVLTPFKAPRPTPQLMFDFF